MGFVEKPNADEIDTNLVNAGAYILERSVLDEMAAAGTRSSIERDLFPRLIDRGLHGCESRGYWMDIGTPQRYLQATYDILDGEVDTELGPLLAAGRGVVSPDAMPAGTVHGPAVLGAGCEIATGATIAGRTVLGEGVTIGRGAHVDSSVVLDGASVGAHTRISRCIVGPGAVIGDHCQLAETAMVGQDVRLGAGNTLRAGVRIFPGVDLPDRAIAF